MTASAAILWSDRSRRSIFGRTVLIAIGLAWLLATSAAAAETPPAIDFSRDIRPILSDRCFHCHGPDAGARQAELRLDTRDGMTANAVVPGKPDESELVRRIFSDDDEERMPPPKSHLALSAGERELLRRWVAEGAVWSEHWAFRPLPDKVEVPPVADASWPRQTLDNFILARLDQEGMQLAAAAPTLRWLRRATLDLTGLPPTVDEVREFEPVAAVDTNTAYERAADRLLASSAYGEHMAVAWLDAARYADSFGYQSDQLNTDWPYRDWVVRALNDNLPYDQFITWQLAGDLLPHATRDQILATAFNRLHRMTNEGGSLAAEALVENASDRVHTFGTALLGLTVECARCHDHKYDPISMRDYYSLTAFFNSIDENGLYDHAAKVPSPSLLLPTEEQQSQLDAAREKVAAAEVAWRKSIDEGRSRFDEWLAGAEPSATSPDLTGYFPFDAEGNSLANEAPVGKGEAKAAGIERVAGIKGRGVRFDGDRGVEFPGLFEVDRWDDFSLDFWLRDAARNPKPVVVLQRTFGTDVGYNGFDLLLEDGVLTARLYRVWPGNAIGVRALEPIARDEWQHVAVTYDGSSKASGLRLYLNGKPLPTEVVRDRIYKSASIHTYGDGRFTLGERFRDRGFKDGAIDELRVFDRAVTPIEIEDLHDGKALADLCRLCRATRDAPSEIGSGASFESRSAPTVLQLTALRDYYFSAVDAEARQQAGELRAARRALVEAEDPLQEVSVMEEMADARPTYVLPRGAYDAPKTDENRVGCDTFHDMLLPFPEGAPRNRLGLGRWMTDPQHPLTARVFVNRLWSNFFGRGLVATPENFGRQGALPTHPELLDWLARDFVDHGWDIKRLCRQIVLSATYRQDSRQRPELRERDPENRLLARGPSRRLSAEETRDVALAASGLLERQLGGPPVAPYQPGQDLWREANEMSPAYHQSTGNDLYRRSLYSVWKRTAPLPNMMAFDAVTREVCVVNRARTNTPLQALVLLNDVQFVEAARALAADVMGKHSEVGDQIGEAFLRLTGRPPDDAELKLLTHVCEEQRKMFAENAEQDATKFTTVGESKPDAALAPADFAAMTVTCQTILNLDATIYER